ncbi:MAG: SEC-C domain-containing protein [Planctomycetes bacterium]|nr:SEC-C domain-containing protein [Planctomycetota bacterium]
MSQAGRNDACPCGSGKKFKRCCGAVVAAPSHFMSQADQQALTRKLVAFLEAEGGAEYFEAASQVLFGGLLEERPSAVASNVLRHENTQVNVTAFVLFDAYWHDEETIVQRYIARHRARLSAAELRYLEAVSDTYVGLYEITEVVLDEGVRLLDLLSGETIWVRERKATHSCARWDLLAARLLREPSGDAIFQADLYAFPQHTKQNLVENLRSFLKLSGKRRFDAEAMLPDLKLVAPLFFGAWWHLVVSPPLPTLTNFDGHVIAMTTTSYDVTDVQAVEQGLNAMSEFEADGDSSWTWLRKIDGQRRVVAHVDLQGARLTLETNSAERAKTAKALLEGRLGAHLRYRSDSVADARAQVQRMRNEGLSPAPQPDPLSAHEQDRVRHEYLEQHYRAWVDQPVPALSHRTPRHAAKLKTQRHKVVDLIKGMENSEAHAAQRGEKPYDFSWLWTELGLEPPGRADERTSES